MRTDCRWRSALRPTGLFALALACAGPAPSPRERVRLATGAYLMDATYFVARELGLFARHGLEVEPIVINNNGVVLATLVGGEVDVASCGPLNARCFNLVERGAPVRFVAARTFYDPAGCAHDAFVVRSTLLATGAVRGPGSLRGLRLSTERTGSNYFYFSRLLAQGGLTMADIEPVDLPVPMRGEALARGTIDVATASEPWATRMTRDGRARIWKRVADVLPGRQSSYLLFGERLLVDRRDLGERFLAAYLEAAQRLREEGKSERVVAAIAWWTKLDPAELREMCWPATPADARPDPATLAEFQQWALGAGLVDAVTPYERLVDAGFLERLAVAHGEVSP